MIYEKNHGVIKGLENITLALCFRRNVEETLSDQG